MGQVSLGQSRIREFDSGDSGTAGSPSMIPRTSLSPQDQGSYLGCGKPTHQLYPNIRAVFCSSTVFSFVFFVSDCFAHLSLREFVLFKIPVEAAVNKNEVEAYKERVKKRQKCQPEDTGATTAPATKEGTTMLLLWREAAVLTASFGLVVDGVLHTWLLASTW